MPIHWEAFDSLGVLGGLASVSVLQLLRDALLVMPDIWHLRKPATDPAQDLLLPEQDGCFARESLHTVLHPGSACLEVFETQINLSRVVPQDCPLGFSLRISP